MYHSYQKVRFIIRITFVYPLPYLPSSPLIFLPEKEHFILETCTKNRQDSVLLFFLFLCLLAYLFICSFICLFVCLLICLFVYLFVCFLFTDAAPTFCWARTAAWWPCTWGQGSTPWRTFVSGNPAKAKNSKNLFRTFMRKTSEVFCPLPKNCWLKNLRLLKFFFFLIVLESGN